LANLQQIVTYLAHSPLVVMAGRWGLLYLPKSDNTYSGHSIGLVFLVRVLVWCFSHSQVCSILGTNVIIPDNCRTRTSKVHVLFSEGHVLHFGTRAEFSDCFF
jgi:hypothetical protein